MENGTLIVPSLRDNIQFVEKSSSPTSSNTSYSIATIWINTSSNMAFIYCGGGVWTKVGGGIWGPANYVTISGGIISVEPGKWYKIETEGGVASDDLDTINGLSTGEEAILSAANGSHTIVLKNGTGNLELRTDISLDDSLDKFRIFHDGSNLVESGSSLS